MLRNDARATDNRGMLGKRTQTQTPATQSMRQRRATTRTKRGLNIPRKCFEKKKKTTPAPHTIDVCWETKLKRKHPRHKTGSSDEQQQERSDNSLTQEISFTNAARATVNKSTGKTYENAITRDTKQETATSNSKIEATHQYPKKLF